MPLGDLGGLDLVLYRGAKGATAATLMSDYRKCKLSGEMTEGDTSRHYWIAYAKAGRWKAGIQFEMPNNDGSADIAFFRAAFYARNPIALKILDCPDGHGIDGDFTITKFELDADEEKEEVYSVEVKPTYYNRHVVAV